MAKTRIHELAKELKMNSKDLIARLRKMGYKVKNHMSTLDEKEVLKIKNKLQPLDAEAKNKSTKTTQQKKTESKEHDYRKRARIRKEEQRKKKEQNQREVLAKVAQPAQRGRGKRRRKEIGKNSKMNREPKKIIIENQISVQELANLLHVSGSEVIKKLISFGVMASLNQVIDSDTATLVAAEFGVDVEVHDESQEWEALLEDTPDRPEDLKPKPPVVTVMGHVDHGKTSLLDFIRHTNVTAREAGGITQHIGAYQIEIKDKKITFLDTPGHEAFTSMRARGAQVTDIAILVVAADDGVMPQTVEAINHAKAADVPIVVAINKIDKPGANPERIKQQLTEHNIVPEEWGGTTVCVPVSAKTGEGVDQLLEMLILVAELEELKANPHCPARGIVIEGELDKGRGPVATMLIQKGTLEIGDVVLAGTSYGRVRAMLDFKGRRIKKATPATPVEILGLSDVPEAGDLFYVLQDEKKARQFVERRLEKKRQNENVTPERVTLEDLFQQIQEGKVKELNLVVKADVHGSVEALIQALAKLHTDEVRINIIHSGVGAVTETDVMLASASNALVIGFNVRPDVNAKKAAESEKVEIRLYRVIYEALEDLKAALEGLLEPICKEVPLGSAEVRDVFHIPKVGAVAGCYVSEGKIVRNSRARVVRDGVVIYDGIIDSLKRFKDDAKEVTQGHECGIGLDKFQDLKIGDVLEGYKIDKIKRELKP